MPPYFFPDSTQVVTGFKAGLTFSTDGLTLSIDTTATAFVSEQPLVTYLSELLGMGGRTEALRQQGMGLGNIRDEEGKKRIRRMFRAVLTTTKGLEVEMESLPRKPGGGRGGGGASSGGSGSGGGGHTSAKKKFTLAGCSSQNAIEYK